MQILQELDILRGPHVSDPKLEYIYEDLLDKVEAALAEIDSVGRTFDGPRGNTPLEDLTDHIQGARRKADEDRHSGLNSPGARRNPSRNQPSRSPSVLDNSFGSPFGQAYSRQQEENSNIGEAEFDPSEDMNKSGMTGGDETHHAMRDGSNESYEEMKERLSSIADLENFDPDRLRQLADVAEKVSEGEEIDPRDMSDSEFEKLLSRLRPNLVDWATGKASIANNLNKNSVVREIQNALERAQEDSEGNIDLLRTFQQEVKDSLFDMSQNMDDGYDPDYENVNDQGSARDNFRDMFSK